MMFKIFKSLKNIITIFFAAALILSLIPIKKAAAEQANTLSEIKGNSKIYLRVEEVNPLGNYSRYKMIASYLNSQNIPFIIVLMPVYFNTDMPAMKKFMDCVRFMQSKGGTVVIHSFLNNEEKSDYLAENENAGVEDRFKKTLLVYTDNKIYPVAIEAPGDVIKLNEYTNIRNSFTTFIKEDDNRDTDDLKFNNIILTSLGKINKSSDLRGIKEKLNNLTVNTQNSVAVSSETDMSVLKKVCTFFNDNEIQFSDLRNETSEVNFDGINIKAENGGIILNGNLVSNIYKTARENKQKIVNTKSDEIGVNKGINEVNRFVAFVVAVFILIFLIVFINGKKTDKRKFLR